MANLHLLRASLGVVLAGIVSAVLTMTAAAATSMSVVPGNWSSSTQVTINWSATGLASGAWIGVYAPASADTSYQTSKSISGTTGVVTFGSLANGSYEARMFGDGGYTLRLASIPFTVAAPTGSLSLSSAAVKVGDSVAVAWQSQPGITADGWVGLFVPGASDTAYLLYKSVAAGTAGTLQFTAPTTAGNYEFRFFADFGYTVKIGSVALSVANPTASLTPGNSRYSSGESVALAWATDTALPSGAWVGIYAAGSDDRSYLTYQQVTPGKSGDLSFTGLAVGSFDARLFGDSGYAMKLATTSFSIGAPVTTPSDTQAPTSVTGLTAVALGPTQINLNWTSSTDNVGVTDYQIYRTVYNNCIATTTTTCAAWYSSTALLTTVTGMPPATSFNDTSVSAGTKYDYTVKACDGAGNCSRENNAASVTTPPLSGANHNLAVMTTGSGYGNVASSPAGISCYVPVPGRYYLIAADCSESYAGGATVTLTATADDGSTFVGWSGACVGTSNTCTLNMSVATSVTANFARAVAAADCLFAWAEKTYPQTFSPAGAASATLERYYYRYYSDQNAYLGISAADYNAYYLGPLSGHQLANLGPVSGWYATARCQ